MANINIKDSVTMQGDIVPDTDNTRDLGSSTNAWAKTYTEDLNVGDSVESNLIPDTDSTRDLGTNAKRWRNAYVDDLYVTSINLPGGSGSGLVPAGAIIMWSGSISSIPTGWALCNGSNGTPNLRNRFVVAAGGSYGVGDTGGQNAITDVPKHSHNVSGNTGGAGKHSHGGNTNSTGNHRHEYQQAFRDNGDYFDANDGGIDRELFYRTRNTSNAGGHSHNISTDTEGNHTHNVSGNTNAVGSSSVDVRPLYYALAYIMKL